MITLDAVRDVKDTRRGGAERGQGREGELETAMVLLATAWPLREAVDGARARAVADGCGLLLWVRDDGADDGDEW